MWPVSWWRWTCSERGACPFYFTKTIGFASWGNNLFSVCTFFWGLSAAQPFTLQQVKNQLVCKFLSQQNTRLFLLLFEVLDLFACGWPRPVSSRSAKQPGSWRSPHIITIEGLKKAKYVASNKNISRSNNFGHHRVAYIICILQAVFLGTSHRLEPGNLNQHLKSTLQIFSFSLRQPSG